MDVLHLHLDRMRRTVRRSVWGHAHPHTWVRPHGSVLSHHRRTRGHTRPHHSSGRRSRGAHHVRTIHRGGRATHGAMRRWRHAWALLWMHGLPVGTHGSWRHHARMARMRTVLLHVRMRRWVGPMWSWHPRMHGRRRHTRPGRAIGGHGHARPGDRRLLWVIVAADRYWRLRCACCGRRGRHGC